MLIQKYLPTHTLSVKFAYMFYLQIEYKLVHLFPLFNLCDDLQPEHPHQPTQPRQSSNTGHDVIRQCGSACKA
jgi:hypothetical protein